MNLLRVGKTVRLLSLESDENVKHKFSFRPAFALVQESFSIVFYTLQMR